MKRKKTPYYYGFFKFPNLEPEIFVVFKTKPEITKSSTVELTGNWAKSRSSRQFFPATDYQIISAPPPLTTKVLREQIQKLLNLAWEYQKQWTQTTEFLTKKQKQLKELEKYHQHPQLLNAYLALKAFYYSNEYQIETYSGKVKEQAWKPVDYYRKQEAFYRGLFWICVGLLMILWILSGS